VTHDVEETDHGTIEAALPDGIEVADLDDVKPEEHPDLVAEVNPILTLLLEREPTTEAVEALDTDQIVQAVSAGVDHLPFERFPDGSRASRTRAPSPTQWPRTSLPSSLLSQSGCCSSITTSRPASGTSSRRTSRSTGRRLRSSATAWWARRPLGASSL